MHYSSCWENTQCSMFRSFQVSCNIFMSLQQEPLTCQPFKNYISIYLLIYLSITYLSSYYLSIYLSSISLLQKSTISREDWGSPFICLHKIKGLQRVKEEICKWDFQEIWMGTQERDICSRQAGQNEHSDSSVCHLNTMPSPQSATFQFLSCSSFN